MSKQLSLIEDEEAQKRKQAASLELIRIADRMEMVEAGSPELKWLRKEYKIAMKAAGITDSRNRVKGAKKIPAKQLEASKAAALVKVKEYLDDIVRWEKELPELVTNNDGYIAVAHTGTSGGMLCEVQLKISDSFYRSYSGCKCYQARVTLFSSKQGKGYGSIEYGLVHFGMSLVKGEERKEFFKKYAVPYNEKIKAKKDEHRTNNNSQ